MASGKGRFYLPQLDGLRFFAFLLVFFSHFQWAPPNLARVPVVGRVLIELHRHGGLGVDLFLVLSAYLITTLLLLEHQKLGRISLKFFYIRRTLRIWPLYFFILALSVLLLPLIQGTFSTPEHQDVLKTHGLFSTFFLANIAELFTDVAVPERMGHLWTISLEEQFYIMWPAMLVVLLSRRKAIPAVLLGAFALSVAARAIIVSGEMDVVIWKFTLTHLDPFALGSLLALYRFNHPGDGKRSGLRLLLGVALIVFTTRFPRPRDETMHVVWTYAVVALGFTFIIDGTLDAGKKWFCRLLSWRPFVWLGQISYGLYVYHLVGIEAGHEVAQAIGASVETTRGWFVHCVVNLGLILGFSYASFTLVEKPFMRMKKRFALVESRDT